MKEDKDLFPTEKCWRTGIYTDECNCDFCEHQFECSAGNIDDDE